MRRVLIAAALVACGPKPQKPRRPLPPIEAARQEILAARDQLRIAEGLLDAGDAPNAYQAALRGIELLGRHYASPSLKDDSSFLLLTAEGDAAVGDHAAAAAKVIVVLKLRIDLYVRRYR